jgi:hypothetical protein
MDGFKATYSRVATAIWRCSVAKKSAKMTFDKFCRNYIPEHPELNLGTDDLSPSEFAKIALEQGRKLGFSFSEAEIQAVLGEHRAVRRQIRDLGAVAKASANGTAMCYQGAMRTDDPIDENWLVIKASVQKK